MKLARYPQVVVLVSWGQTTSVGLDQKLAHLERTYTRHCKPCQELSAGELTGLRGEPTTLLLK